MQTTEPWCCRGSAAFAQTLEEFILSKFSRGLDERKVKGYDISQALLRRVLPTLSKWKVRMSKAYS